jgi:hypothetical protein
VQGAVGSELTKDEGYRAARLTGLSIIASLKHARGELDRVSRWLRAVGYVQAAPGFHDNAQVLNGFTAIDPAATARRRLARPRCFTASG